MPGYFNHPACSNGSGGCIDVYRRIGASEVHSRDITVLDTGRKIMGDFFRNIQVLFLPGMGIGQCETVNCPALPPRPRRTNAVSLAAVSSDNLSGIKVIFNNVNG